MTYTPRASVLQGLSFEVASCFGMPHYGAKYRTPNVHSNQLIPGTLCAVCHRPATNSHHEPPLSKGRFVLHGYELKPALIALCGSGTTGCHGRRHRRKLKIRWVWDSEAFKILWWEGLLFEAGIRSNDPRLYKFGRWVFEWQK